MDETLTGLYGSSCAAVVHQSATDRSGGEGVSQGQGRGFTKAAAFLSRHIRSCWLGAAEQPWRVGRQLSAQVKASDLLKAHKLPAPLMWIQHWRKDSTGGGAETFALIGFSSYEVE